LPKLPHQGGGVKPRKLNSDTPASAGTARGVPLRELLRTNDIVLVSAVEALLSGAGINHLVFDQNMSVIEGSLGVLPRRLLVAEEDLDSARELLTEAGLGHELRHDE
jgi:hypothetical protein